MRTNYKSLATKILIARQRTIHWARGINVAFPEVKFIDVSDSEQTGVRRCFRCKSKFMPLYKEQIYCRDNSCKLIKSEKTTHEVARSEAI